MQPPALIDLVDQRRLRVLDVDDHQPLLAGGDVGVGAGQVDVVDVRRARSVRHRLRMGQVGHVEHLQAFLVADEGVAELHLHGDSGSHQELRRPRTAVTHGLGRVFERHDDQARVAADVGVVADDRDRPRPVEQAVRD